MLRAFYQLSCLARGWGWFVLAAKLEELKPREETKKYVPVTLNMRIDREIEVNLFFYSFIFVKKYVFVTHGSAKISIKTSRFFHQCPRPFVACTELENIL